MLCYCEMRHLSRLTKIHRPLPVSRGLSNIPQGSPWLCKDTQYSQGLASVPQGSPVFSRARLRSLRLPRSHLGFPRLPRIPQGLPWLPRAPQSFPRLVLAPQNSPVFPMACLDSTGLPSSPEVLPWFPRAPQSSLGLCSFPQGLSVSLNCHTCLCLEMEFFSMYHGTFLLVIPLLSRDLVSPPRDKACSFSPPTHRGRESCTGVLSSSCCHNL